MSEEERIEADYSESELEILREAVLQANDMILITDAELDDPGPRIVFVNDAFLKNTGYSKEEVIGKTPRILQGPKTNMAMLRTLKETIARGEYFAGATVNYRKNKTPYHVEWHISPIRDSSGKVLYYVSIQKDVTKREIASELIKLYTEDLEREVRKRSEDMVQTEKMSALGTMVAGVAHEINNPTAYIKSNFELMREDLADIKEKTQGDQEVQKLIEGFEKMLDANIEGVQRITKITSTLKNFAKKTQDEFSNSDINQGIEDTLIIAHNRLKNRITVHKQLTELPRIKCDISSLNQVFLNLILNAADAMEKGDIWIKTHTSLDHIHIEIEDNGSGIPEDKLQHIFDPFFTTKDEGTGLGLSISYKIVKRHNGNIEVRSSVGEGTRFKISLPMVM